MLTSGYPYFLEKLGKICNSAKIQTITIGI